MSSLKDEQIVEILDEDINISSPSSENTNESDDFEITANVNDEIYKNDEPDSKTMSFINKEIQNIPLPAHKMPTTVKNSVSSFLDSERYFSYSYNKLKISILINVNIL